MFSMTLPRKIKGQSLLPGFSLTLGVTVGWVGFLLLLPITALLFSSVELNFSEFWNLITRPAALASFRITLFYAAVTSFMSTVIGVVVAWTLVRYRFWGRLIFDSLIDLPFAIPGAVGGIALAAVFGSGGIVGDLVEPLGIQLVYNQTGIFIALLFVCLPFSVRSVQPLIQQLSPESEVAARMLGASDRQIFFRVTLPSLIPGIYSGFILSFARAIGEYGTVVFVAGNIPLQSEVISRYIYNKMDQYDAPGAAAIATVLLFISLLILLSFNRVHGYIQRRMGRE